MSLPVQVRAVTADTLIVGGKAQFYGADVLETGASTTTVKVYDGTDNTGLLIASFALGSGGIDRNGPFNRGILCEQGIFVDLVTGASTIIVYYQPQWVLDATVLVEFAGSQRYVTKYLTQPDIYDAAQETSL
jgi:hypothetical protein